MTGNKLIDSLPEDLQEVMIGDLEEKHLPLREDILQPGGEALTHVYFPVSCMLSQVINTSEGQTIEAMLAGRTGFIGLPVLLGGDYSDYDVIVQIPGTVLRMRADALRRHLMDERLRDTLGKFGLYMTNEIAQSVACAAFHEVRERLARWLLLVREATSSDEFYLTHAYIGVLLGAHRPTVSIAVQALEAAGLIENRRGQVRIRDSRGLAQAACECYHRTHPTTSS